MLEKLYFSIMLFCLNRLEKKTHYWQFNNDEGQSVQVGVRSGNIYLLKDDYEILKNTLSGSLLIKEFKDKGVKIIIADEEEEVQ